MVKVVVLTYILSCAPSVDLGALLVHLLSACSINLCGPSGSPLCARSETQEIEFFAVWKREVELEGYSIPFRIEVWKLIPDGGLSRCRCLDCLWQHLELLHSDSNLDGLYVRVEFNTDTTKGEGGGLLWRGAKSGCGDGGADGQRWGVQIWRHTMKEKDKKV
jgi:hypothetical protein